MIYFKIIYIFVMQDVKAEMAEEFDKITESYLIN